jgi:alkanesulfonate monooxygenase SsuD/methylene tetrahydromethanopterin reductase-like flavin-dependent oxidoreductase (luciferase family)
MPVTARALATPTSSSVFLAASHPKPLQVAGRTAEGVFVNYGLGADDIRESRMPIVAGAKAAGRAADDPEIWQVAALDCNDDRDLARNKVGAMLARATPRTRRAAPDACLRSFSRGGLRSAAIRRIASRRRLAIPILKCRGSNPSAQPRSRSLASAQPAQSSCTEWR